MAFQITPLRIPSLTPDFSAENQAFSRLGATLGNLIPEMRKEQLQEQKQQLLGQIGSGTLDYDKGGRALIALGDTQAGATLLGLGQKAKEQTQGQTLLNSWGVGGEASAGSPAGVAPSAPSQMPATTQPITPGDRSLPRGIRNNNPGNIEAGAFTQGLPGFQGSDGRFARFETPEQGIVAADRLLQSYAGRGLNTVAGIVNRWAPPSENNTGAYVASVARELGVQPDQPLDMASPDVRQKLIAAKIRVENGRQPYGEDVFARAYGRGAPAAPAAPGVQVAETEEDVQRLETQMAQAQSGTPMSDVPASGAALAQGFVVPGQGGQVAVEADPKVKLWQQRYTQAASVGNERAMKIAEKNLEMATKAAERRYAEGKAPEAVREWQWARDNGLTDAKNPIAYAKEKADATKEGNPAALVGQRRAAAQAAGLRETDPGYQSYILTGKMPREDAQPLTATDKKAILEADEGVEAANSAISALREAKKISPQALGGWGAGKKAAVANNLPDWMVPDALVASPKQGEATAQLDNLVGTNALSQLKAIFGGNPTEGERAIMMELQGSSSQPDSVRQKIYDRAITMAERRLSFQQQRATELRGGTYYKPGTGEPGGQARQPESSRAPAPDVSNAKQASDGNWYVPDPSRPGKYLMVQP